MFVKLLSTFLRLTLKNFKNCKLKNRIDHAKPQTELRFIFLFKKNKTKNILINFTSMKVGILLFAVTKT